MIGSPTVTIQQQGMSWTQEVGINPLNGFTSTVSVKLQGLPSGVSASPSGPYSFTPGGDLQGVFFDLSAQSKASVGTSTITVNATSGSITHTTTFSVQVTQQAPFTIHVSPTSLTLKPASTGMVQVSVTANAGTSPSLIVALPNMPTNSGLTLLKPQSLLTTSNPVSFTVEASDLAQPLTGFPITVTGEDNSNNTSTVTVPLTVSVPYGSSTAPTRSTFVRTDATPTDAVYDTARKLVFVSVQDLNEVVVLSSTDGHRVATIPVEFPTGIDESADGSEVIVGSESPYLTIIDPNTLQVVRKVPGPVPAFKRTTVEHDWSMEVATLSNGDVLILAEDPFSSSLYQLYLWNPATGAMTLKDLSSLNFSPGSLHRSADHTKVLDWGAGPGGSAVVIYDVASDSFSGPKTFPDVAGFAMSPDGSQFVVVGLQNQPTTFYDSQFNLLGSLSLDTLPLSGAIYSTDGKRVYVATSIGVPAIAAIDTTTFSLAGMVPDFQVAGLMEGTTPFAIDETGMIFGGNLDGVDFVDASSPGLIKLPFPGTFTLHPALLSASSPTQTQLSGAFSSTDFYSVYFGAPPASAASQMGSDVSVQNSNTISVTAPPGTRAGPANVTLTRPDGWWGVMPDAASYGPTFLYADPAAGPTAGGSSVTLYGYGFVSPSTQVTIGGSPATITQVSGPGFLSPYPFPLDMIELKTPAGNPGTADLTITTPSGSTTVTGGFQYLASAQVYPVAGALDAIIYDQPRQRLYITNQDNNCVEVFDLGSRSFLPPIPVGNQPTGLALTPDGSMLAVVNKGDGTVSVIDPSKMQVVATYPVLTSADKTAAAEATQIAPVEPHRMLVELVNTSTLDSGTLHLLDLDNGSLSCAGVVACDSTGFNIDFDTGLEDMASTSDGSEVFLTDFSQVSAQPVGWLNFGTNTLTTAPILAAHDDAVDADGNVFMASISAFNQEFLNTGVLNDVDYLDTGGGDSNNVQGEKLNPSGSLLFIPQHTPLNGSQSGMDIFDVHRARLAMRVALPEQIPFCLNALALDETGTKMFLISKSGVTIAQLAQAPLSIATVNPSSAAAGTQVTIRGSGFQDGATVTFGKTKEVATYVDSETLKTTVPSLSSGPVRVTVTNADGKSYSFDAAFTEN